MAQTSDLVNKSFLRSELKREFKKSEDRLVEKIKTSEDRVVEKIIKELKDMQEDSEVHQFSHSRINDDLAELDTRVQKLEKATPAHP